MGGVGVPAGIIVMLTPGELQNTTASASALDSWKLGQEQSVARDKTQLSLFSFAFVIFCKRLQ